MTTTSISLSVTVGLPWDSHMGRSIQLNRYGHHPQLVGHIRQLPVGDRRGHDRWTLELTPYVKDRLNSQQRLSIESIAQLWGDMEQARNGAYVVAGMLLAWWLANQLPRNTFDDLETAVAQ